MLTKIVPLQYSLMERDCHPELARGRSFHQSSFGIGSASYEEAIFLYGLVMVLKPVRALETGTERGFTTLHIALALAHTGAGVLDAVERDARAAARTRDALEREALADRVVIHTVDSLEFIDHTEERYDFAFLDSSLALRLKEFRSLRSKLNAGSFVVIHDTSPEHPLNRGRVAFEQELAGERTVYIPSPRGMTVIQV